MEFADGYISESRLNDELIARLRLHAAGETSAGVETMFGRDTAEAADALEAAESKVQAMQARIAELEQTSADYCEECGWRTKFPDKCLMCDEQKSHAMQAELEAARNQLQIARGALADFAVNKDMSLTLMRTKAKRLYNETGVRALASPEKT